MPQKKKVLNIVLTMSSLLLLTLVLFKLFPVSQLKAEVTSELVEIALSTEAVNTYDNNPDNGTAVTVCALIDVPDVGDTFTVSLDYTNPYIGAEAITGSLVADTAQCETIMGIDMGALPAEYDAYGNLSLLKADLEFPVPSYQGEWRVNIIPDTDPAEEIIWYTDAYITNMTETPDTTPPEIVTWAFEPEVINTEGEDVEVTMYARLSDDISALSEGYAPTIGLQALNTENPDSYYTSIDFELELLTDEVTCSGLDVAFTSGLDGCGDYMDGIYSATVTLYQYSRKGRWEVGRIDFDEPNEYGELYRQVGNLDIRDNTENSIDTANFDEDVDNIYLTNNATIHDVVEPELVSLTMTPTTFNSDLGDATITVTMNVKDNLSGVVGAEVYIRPLVPGGEIRPADEYTVSGSTIKEGELSFDITIEQGSKTGLWVIDQIGIRDKIGNRHDVSSLKRISHAFPNLELFLVNQAIKDEVLIEEDWYIEEWDDYGTDFYLTYPDMSVDFQAGTVVTKKEGGSFAFHRMLTRKYDMSKYTSIDSFITEANQQLSTDIQACDSSEGCFDSQLNTNNLTGEPLNIIKMGIPGLNLSFSKPVTITIAVDDQYLGTTFVVQTFDHETNEWTNETTCLVDTVVPSSYGEEGGGPDGFFKPSPYTACQFQVDHASFFSTNILGENTTEEAGVPNTGVGGFFNYLRKWLR